MKGRIVAIGGGEPGRPAALLPILREIVRLSGKRRPRALFIPTASGDSPEVRAVFEALYARRLGLPTDQLLLFAERPSPAGLAAKIAGADIVHVGGGNTFRMMRLWRRLGVDRLLDRARRRGAVLCGGSAGSICWFREGNSDSRKKHPRDTTLIRVSGLGWIDALHCPHFNSEKHRPRSLKRMMRNIPGVAVAIEDGCALEVVDGRWRVLSAVRGRKAYRAFWKRGRYALERLPEDGLWRPLGPLLKKP